MTEDADKRRVRRAKGAAQEVIGKLIGDDAEIGKGRAKRQRATAAIDGDQSHSTRSTD